MLAELLPQAVDASEGDAYWFLNNLEVVKARKGPVIAIATEGNTALAGQVDDIIYVPPTLECLFPLLAVVPLQLLAYHIAAANANECVTNVLAFIKETRQRG